MSNNYIIDKAVKVMNSVETFDQYVTANKYITLASKRFDYFSWQCAKMREVGNSKLTSDLFSK